MYQSIDQSKTVTFWGLVRFRILLTYSLIRQWPSRHVFILSYRYKGGVEITYSNTVRHSRQTHICPHSVHSMRNPEIVFVMNRKLSSAVCGRVSGVPLTHTRPNCLTRPQRRLLIPKQSLRVWAFEDESCRNALSRFWRLSVGWARFDPDIRGFPVREGLGLELFNGPAVDLTPGFDEDTVRVTV